MHSLDDDFHRYADFHPSSPFHSTAAYYQHIEMNVGYWYTESLDHVALAHGTRCLRNTLVQLQTRV